MTAQLREIIRTRLLGIPRDEQDVYLEDSDWRVILSALEGVSPYADALRAMLDHYGPPASIAAMCEYPDGHPITLARAAIAALSEESRS